jgi:hypothetical protein
MFQKELYNGIPNVTMWPERLPLVGEVSANFVDRGCHKVSATDPYSHISAF